MRNLYQMLIASVLLVGQVASSLPHTATEAAQALRQAAGQTQKLVNLNLNSPNAVEAIMPQPADFDSEILQPLHQEQAKRHPLVGASIRHLGGGHLFGPATGDIWYALRLCEAGNDYARNSGNGYFGAYQFSLSAWGNFAGFARPDLAPPAVQDQKAHELQAARGWYPWPACSRRLGLL